MNWLPTAENVNALPDGLRDYIHDLEIRCDPAGEVRSLELSDEQVTESDEWAWCEDRLLKWTKDQADRLRAMVEQFISDEGLIPRNVFRVDDVEEIKA